MINHQNRTPAYRVQLINGRFDHVRGKQAAIARAIEMAGADPKTSEADLRKHWGVSIDRVTAEIARSVGL
jgi:hypothetical protein